MTQYRYSAQAKYHVVLIQPISGVVNLKVPALYLKAGSETVLVKSLIEYFLMNPNQSMSWMRTVARALGLFYDYCQAYSEIHSAAHGFNFKSRLLRDFGLALHRGTLDSHSQADVLKLFWPPSSIRNAKTLLASLQNFTEWCELEGLIPDHHDTANEIPSNEPTSLKFLAQAVKAKNFMFLSHIASISTIAQNLSRRHNKRIIHLGSTNHFKGETKRFPAELVAPLMQYGFVKDETSNIPEIREDLTAKMITILLMFGGTRVSEPYHLWFNDVIPQVDGSCKVQLRHPSDAYTDIIGEESILRSRYLAERSLLPRNSTRNSKSYKAGWKELKVDNTLSAHVFFLHQAAEKLFREMYIYYLNYRQVLMRSYIEKNGTDHPFLFVKQVGNPGEPYSIQAYIKALKKAYWRIEIRDGISINYGKQEGTSPHGMRHLYGQVLSEAGMAGKIIQDALRHRSIASQGVYTAPTFNHVTNELAKAKAHIESGASTSLQQNAIDALEWFND